MDARKIGNFIRQRRKELGMSIETLSADIGVFSVQVESWENGEKVPETKYLLAIANELQCSVEDLLNGLEEEINEEIIEEVVEVESEQVSQDHSVSQANQVVTESVEDKEIRDAIKASHKKSIFYHDAVDKNGFLDIERSIMYVFCILILIIFIPTNVYRLYRWNFTPITLTTENAREYLEIDADYDITDKEIVLIVKNKDAYDIKDFSIEITVEISNIKVFPGHHVEDAQTFTIRIDNFPSNQTITKKLQISYSNDLVEVSRTNIDAISGRL